MNDSTGIVNPECTNADHIKLGYHNTSSCTAPDSLRRANIDQQLGHTEPEFSKYLTALEARVETLERLNTTENLWLRVRAAIILNDAKNPTHTPAPASEERCVHGITALGARAVGHPCFIPAPASEERCFYPGCDYDHKSVHMTYDHPFTPAPGGEAKFGWGEEPENIDPPKAGASGKRWICNKCDLAWFSEKDFKSHSENEDFRECSGATSTVVATAADLDAAVAEATKWHQNANDRYDWSVQLEKAEETNAALRDKLKEAEAEIEASHEAATRNLKQADAAEAREKGLLKMLRIEHGFCQNARTCEVCAALAEKGKP